MVYEAQAPENLEGKGWTMALAGDQLLSASNRNNLNIGLKLRRELTGPVSLPDGTRLNCAIGSGRAPQPFATAPGRNLGAQAAKRPGRQFSSRPWRR